MLIQSLQALPSLPNQISLTWLQPLGFNLNNEELIITKTSSFFPMELYNASFPNSVTDPRGIEIFRGWTIVGTSPGTISVAGAILTDSGAIFPVSSSLRGRLLRDSNSQVFKILDNTSTTVTLNGNPANGIYVILADFPTTTQIQQNFEFDIRTTSDVGTISNLVQIFNGIPSITSFTEDQLVNMIFIDGASNKFIVKANTTNTITFFESSVTPVVGYGMAILNSFSNSSPIPYIDTFKTDIEAANRLGTGLLDNTFYYYTGFTHLIGTNVAQVEFGTVDASSPTQVYAISAQDRKFGDLLFNVYWPTVFRQLDATGDLEDVMRVFGFQFNELHAYIDTFKLQDSDNIVSTALVPLSNQFGLPSVGFSIGIDTLRRIARNMISAWKLKGSKQGIALFIRILTTWDITNGSGNISDSISDFLPNIEALRLFSASLGNLNTRFTQTQPFIAGGRFAKSLPGIIIPGFFTFREFVITLPNVAMFVGTTTDFAISSGTTIITNSAANFGADNSLVGNFLLPNQEEVNDIFQIIANTSTTITVQGVVNNQNAGGTYAVLSPLNTNRFRILNKLLPIYIPFGTFASFNFTIV